MRGQLLRVCRGMSGVNSFHGFNLPEDLLDFRSSESKKRLIRCMSEGTAVPYLHLSSCYKPQTEPSYCGISTLVVVLNALDIDPKTMWKEPWRWFTEEVLERSMDAVELDLMKKSGVTMEAFQNMAQQTGATCSLIHAEDTKHGYEEFLDDLYRVCTGERHSRQLKGNSKTIDECASEEYLGEIMAVAFHRQSLNQHGDGHFSPIAAFDLTTNSVLVLDTARFKYCYVHGLMLSARMRRKDYPG